MKTLALLLCLLSSCAIGQTVPKIGVKFVCTCNDMVGARYATAIRDLIAVSPRYAAANDFVEGPANARVFNMGIRAITLDPQVGSPGNGTAVAVTITWGYLYINNILQICTSESVKECAENTIASFDAAVATIQPPQNSSAPAYVIPERKYDPNSPAK